MNAPTPLVIGDCSILRIYTVTRAIIMTIKVPCTTTEENNDEIIHEHVQKWMRKAFDYMIAEGFIVDRNYTINIAITQK